MCNGCRGHYSQFDEMVVKHVEFRHFTNPQTGLPAKRFGNTCYHCQMACILLKCPGFCGHLLVVEDDVKKQLSDIQKALVITEFNVIVP